MDLMPAKSYKPRVVDDELKERLQSAGAVLIEGPKACGTTKTARQLAASEVLLDVDQNARAAVALNPALVLDGGVDPVGMEDCATPGLSHARRRA